MNNTVLPNFTLLPTESTTAAQTSGVSSDVQSAIILYVYRVAIPIILIVGIVGNLLNLAVMWRSKTMRNLPYLFLRWLAISDLSHVILFVPYFLRRSHLLDQTYMLLWFHTHIDFFLIECLSASSDYLIVALTVDRFLAICYPLHYRNISTAKLKKITIAAIFLVSFVIHTPYTFYTIVVPDLRLVKQQKTDSVQYRWMLNPDIIKFTFFSKVYPCLIGITGTLLPVTIVLVLNPLIIKRYHGTLVRRRTLKDRKSSESNQSSQKEERRITFLLLVTSLVFLICTVPAAFTSIFILSQGKANYLTNKMFYIFTHINLFLHLLNHSSNFYTYSVSSAEFRRNFGNVFTCHLGTRISPGI